MSPVSGTTNYDFCIKMLSKTRMNIIILLFVDQNSSGRTIVIFTIKCFQNNSIVPPKLGKNRMHYL